jgi:hypothetical protein
MCCHVLHGMHLRETTMSGLFSLHPFDKLKPRHYMALVHMRDLMIRILINPYPWSRLGNLWHHCHSTTVLGKFSQTLCLYTELKLTLEIENYYRENNNDKTPTGRETSRLVSTGGTTMDLQSIGQNLVSLMMGVISARTNLLAARNCRSSLTGTVTDQTLPRASDMKKIQNVKFVYTFHFSLIHCDTCSYHERYFLKRQKRNMA